MSNNLSISDKIKETGKHTIIYGIGSTLSTLTSFILIPLYTNCFTSEEYGIFSLIFLCSTIAGSISYLGIVSALSRSYFDYDDESGRKKTISTTFYLLSLGASTQAVIGFFIGPSVSKLLFQTEIYGPHIFMVLLSSSFTILNNVPFLILKIKKKSKTVVSINILSFLLQFGLILFFVAYLRSGIIGIIYGTLISTIVLFSILFYMIRDQLIIAFSKYECKLQLKWGIPVLLGNFGVLSLNWADRYIINILGSLSDVGIYALGYSIGMAIKMLFVDPFNTIWNPVRMEYRNDENSKIFYTHVFTYYLLIGSFICIGLSLFSKEFLIIVSGRAEYLEAFKIVPFVAFGYLFSGMGSLVNHGVIFERKIHYGTFITFLFAGFNLLLNIILIPIYGYIGAAFATLICFIGMLYPTWYISNKFYKMTIEKRRVAIILFTSFILVIIGFLFDLPFFTSLLFKSGLIFLYLVIFWFLPFFSREEKEKIKELLTSCIPRIYKCKQKN